MAKINFEDRVLDTTTTTGTGDITLSGTAPVGYITFNTAFGLNTRCYYVIDSGGGSEWEIGAGYLTSSTVLVREDISGSSNAGALVNFSAGTKNVFCALPANYLRRLATLGRSLTVGLGNFNR